MRVLLPSGAYPPANKKGDVRRAALMAALAGMVVSSGWVQAQMIAQSARQMSPRSLKWTVFYQGTQGQDLNFTQTVSGVCSGGGANNPAFPCTASGNVGGKADGGAGILQVGYQPWDGLQYYAGAGVGDLKLRVASAGTTNVLTGDRPGYLYHAGAHAVLIPDTLAGPAIALDGRIGWQRYFFNEVHPFAANAGQINQRLDMYQYQVAVETSHRFDFSDPKWSIEPYGGIKWLRTHSYLKDLQSGDRTGGIKDAYTPFVGVVLPIYEHEALTSEASFVSGIQYSAGLQVQF